MKKDQNKKVKKKLGRKSTPKKIVKKIGPEMREGGTMSNKAVDLWDETMMLDDLATMLD